MSTDKDRLVALNGRDGDFLERVEFEGVGTGGLGERDVRGDRDVGVVRGESDLMADLRPKEVSETFEASVCCESRSDWGSQLLGATLPGC